MEQEKEKEIYEELCKTYYKKVSESDFSAINMREFYSEGAQLIRSYPGKKPLSGSYEGMKGWMAFDKTKKLIISKYELFDPKAQPINFVIKGIILSTRTKKYYFTQTFILESISPLKILRDCLYIFDPDNYKEYISFEFKSYEEEEQEEEEKKIEEEKEEQKQNDKQTEKDTKTEETAKPSISLEVATVNSTTTSNQNQNKAEVPPFSPQRTNDRNQRNPNYNQGQRRDNQYQNTDNQRPYKSRGRGGYRNHSNQRGYNPPNSYGNQYKNLDFSHYHPPKTDDANLNQNAPPPKQNQKQGNTSGGQSDSVWDVYRPNG